MYANGDGGTGIDGGVTLTLGPLGVTGALDAGAGEFLGWNSRRSDELDDRRVRPRSLVPADWGSGSRGIGVQGSPSSGVDVVDDGSVPA